MIRYRLLLGCLKKDYSYFNFLKTHFFKQFFFLSNETNLHTPLLRRRGPRALRGNTASPQIKIDVTHAAEMFPPLGTLLLDC